MRDKEVSASSKGPEGRIKIYVLLEQDIKTSDLILRFSVLDWWMSEC